MAEDIELARKLIPDLVVVIRGLLFEHTVQDDARCQVRGSAWPCPVVATVHALVKDPQHQFVGLFQRTYETWRGASA